MSEKQLKQEIIKLSESDEWETAMLEWGLDDIYESSESVRCLCNHFPIKELCILKNNKNKKRAKVGNVCVKKFLGLPSDRIFNAIKRVKKNIEKSLNTEAIQHAKKKGWISDKEFLFLLDTMRKTKITEKQLNWRKSINRQILFRWTLESKKQHKV